MSGLMIPLLLQGIAVIMYVQSNKQDEQSKQRHFFRMASIIFFILSILAFVFEASVAPPA